MAIIVIWLIVFTNVQTLFFLIDILESSISFSWRRLTLFCVRSVLLQPELFMFRFKVDLSVLYFLTFFQIVLIVGETPSRKRCSKSCWTSLKCLKIRCSLVSCILEVLRNECIDLQRSGFNCTSLKMFYLPGKDAFDNF